MKIKPHLNPIIDGDILIYRLGFAADAGAKKESDDWENPELNYLPSALYLVDHFMKDITETVFPECERYWLYLTGKDNYRHEVATIKPYKGNRQDAKKPKYYQELRDYMVSAHGAEVVDGIEADDALGQLQFSNPDKSTVIVTIDKDLNMIPGYHYNFVKGEFYDVKIKEGNLSFLRQMLEGDSTDNIPGIAGIGKKRVLEHIPDKCPEEEAIQTVARHYRIQYPDTYNEAIEEIATLLWIRRNTDEACPFVKKIQEAAISGSA